VTGGARLARTAPTPLRVSLARPDPHNLDQIRPWFGDAWLEMFGGPAVRAGLSAPEPEDWLRHPGTGLTSYLVVIDGEPIGFLACALGAGRISIDALAIVSGRRNRGYGAEAVFAAEALAGPDAATRALVPMGNGLAVYFWLRVGFRPLFLADHGLDGVTVMARGPGGTATGSSGECAER
jgi:hypothetical protein